MIFTRDMNDGRNIFVFGSNEGGIHAGGAAREAANHWGAKMGNGVGREGQSFAIPTMDDDFKPLPLDEIRHYVNDFFNYTRQHMELKFLVTAIGTGICGYAHEQIAPLFKDAPANCVLPDEWKDLV